ncbi:MAG TPA: hypothetical protein VK211_09690 [Kamptonema sp.]|nr:hypothetical protein [Kamptonema sp.]
MFRTDKSFRFGLTCILEGDLGFYHFPTEFSLFAIALLILSENLNTEYKHYQQFADWEPSKKSQTVSIETF